MFDPRLSVDQGLAQLPSCPEALPSKLPPLSFSSSEPSIPNAPYYCDGNYVAASLSLPTRRVPAALISSFPSSGADGSHSPILVIREHLRLPRSVTTHSNMPMNCAMADAHTLSRHPKMSRGTRGACTWKSPSVLKIGSGIRHRPRRGLTCASLHARKPRGWAPARRKTESHFCEQHIHRIWVCPRVLRKCELTQTSLHSSVLEPFDCTHVRRAPSIGCAKGPNTLARLGNWSFIRF